MRCRNVRSISWSASGTFWSSKVPSKPGAHQHPPNYPLLYGSGFIGLLGLIGLVGFMGFMGFIGLIGLVGFMGFAGLIGFIGFRACHTRTAHSEGTYGLC